MRTLHRVIAILMFTSCVASAATLEVNKSDCSEHAYCDIQAAIDAADEGDTISIAAGDYELWQESIHIKKSLILRGAGASTTRLMGEGNAPESLVNVADGVGSVTLSGMTLRDRVVSGSPAMGPGGLDHRGDDLNLRDIAFINNRGGWGGAARIQTLFGLIKIDNCTFEKNTGFAGGGLAVYNGTALELSINNSVFKNNNAVFSGGALLMRDAAEVSLTNVLIENNSAGNTGGGAHFFTDISSSQIVIKDSTIVRNEASKSGGLSTFGDSVSVALHGSTLQSNKSFDTPDTADCGGAGFELHLNNRINQQNLCSN